MPKYPVEEALLREPNLWVPGKRFLGAVKLDERANAESFFLFNRPGVPRDIAHGKNASAISSGYSYDHRGIVCPGGDSDRINLPLSDFLVQGNVTWTFYVSPNATEDNAVLYSHFPATGATRYFTIYVGDGITGSLTNELITLAYAETTVGNNGLFGYTTTNRAELFDGKPHVITARADGTSWRLWLDGEEKTLTVGSGANKGLYYSSGPAFITTSTLFGRVVSGSASFTFSGAGHYARFDRRALSSGEIVAIHEDPYADIFPA